MAPDTQPTATPAGKRYEIKHSDGIAILRMANAPVNAIGPVFVEQLHTALEELAADLPDALVLTGTDKFFSAGLDLKVTPKLDLEGQRSMIDRMNALFRPLFGFPRPMVSAINGHAVAAGFVMALAGDFRVASLEGSYGLTEVRVGMDFPPGVIETVQAELPAQSARKLVLGAELVDAETARELGAFDEVLPPGEVLPRALEVARRLAGYSSEVYARSKLALRAPLFESVERILEGGDPLSGAWMVEESARAARIVLKDS